MPRRKYPQPHQPFRFEDSCQRKRRYSSQSDVDAAIEIASLERPQVELKSYQCPRCQNWHLTSVK